MRVCYIPSDMDAPGSYRCLFPMRQLKEQGGHTVMLTNFKEIEQPGGRRKFQFNVELDPPMPWADIWVLQQRLERMWAEEGVQRLRSHGITTVAEVDDNYLELPAWNPAFEGTHPYRRDDGVIVNRAERRHKAKQLGWKKIPPNASNRNHMFKTFSAVDAMTVSTPYLADLYRPYNKNIHVIRNVLDWNIWEDITPQYEVKRWEGRIRIGYLGVFRYRQGDLSVIRGVIRPFLDKHPNVDFVANSKEVHDYLGVPERRRVIVKEYDFYPRDTSQGYPVGRKTAVLDIGLVPLLGGGMNEGKSHLKGMEYNAAGVPFIASPTESYNYWTEEAQNGFRAYNEKDWMNMLEWYVTHDTERRMMGERGRIKSSQHTFQKRWYEWQDVYEGILGDEFNALARGAVARGAVQKVSELSSLLREASDRGRPKVVVEIGSALGGTFWALSQIADPHATMVSIDIPAGSPIDVRNGVDVYGDRDRDRFKLLVKETQALKLIDANSQKYATLEQLIDCLGTRKIDLLFIDGDHRYEGVKRDYNLYSPLVREGGLIAFHDVIRQNDARSGVHLLWHQLQRKAKWSREWIGTDNWGWGNWGAIGVIEQEQKVVSV